jgi:hypothetical protein
MDATQGLAAILRDARKSALLRMRDTPLEPVIGLAEGETRWRGMTTSCEPASAAMMC